MRPLIQATRTPVECTLRTITGSIPDDWYGSVFINSSAGTVHSPLPFSPDSQEMDSSVMNGDGYMWRFDLSAGNVFCKGNLLKPPCFYADSAATGALKTFRNMGISRMSYLYGFRDELSTAVTPFKIPSSQEDNTSVVNRFLACYDAGRPWEFDPTSLRVIAPVGMNSEWTSAIPDVPNPQKPDEMSSLFPFPLVQSTAHPSYDPLTGEMFLVNFTKSLSTMLHGERLIDDIRKLEDAVIAELDGLAERILKDLYAEVPKETVSFNIAKISEWFESRLAHAQSEEERVVIRWYQSILEHRRELVTRSEAAQSGNKAASTGMGDEVILKRWNGQHGANSRLDSWQVTDTEGKNLQILQCMHQTALTEHFLVLSDSTFKFSLDLMMNFNSPFISPLIKEFCRIILSVPQEPHLDVYVVPRPPKRSPDDFSPSINGTLVCFPLDKPVPLEAVHYSVDYNDSDNIITLHLAHNSAACLAEWVRTFDTLSYDALHTVPSNVVGLPAAGEMDIGRIGKCVIRVDAVAKKAIQQSFDVIMEPGNIKDIEHIGKHTWGVGLYTYRNIIAADTVERNIEYIYWSCYGFDPRLQTTFLEGLYWDYPNRAVAIHDVQQIAKAGVPFVLVKQNTKTMTLEDDYFQFPRNVILKSIQFVPRAENPSGAGNSANTNNTQAKQSSTERHRQTDGYIFSTVLVCRDGDYGTDYECQIWIFKAWELSAGPCCTLTNEQLDYAFTLHSAWVDTIEHLYDQPSDAGYSVQADYEPIVRNLLLEDIPFIGPILKVDMEIFFRENVYKPFNAK